MSKNIKIAVEVILFAVCVLLVILIVTGIEKPVKFNDEKVARENVGIQRLKDIRTLQVAFKGVYGKFTSSTDSLIDFYNKGQMSILMQVGSSDDSLSVAHTEALKKSLAKTGRKKLSDKEINAKLYEAYQNGDDKLVFSVETKIPVRDTLFLGREDFVVDSIKTIPFSGGIPVIMEAVVKSVSGVQVPLFEAKMPYKALLRGMDNQLRINLDDERKEQNKYEGLQVGSVTNPNNNAGNWE